MHYLKADPARTGAVVQQWSSLNLRPCNVVDSDSSYDYDKWAKDARPTKAPTPATAHPSSVAS